MGNVGAYMSTWSVTPTRFFKVRGTVCLGVMNHSQIRHHNAQSNDPERGTSAIQWLLYMVHFSAQALTVQRPTEHKQYVSPCDMYYNGLLMQYMQERRV
jgi:hypothetical protein